MSLLLDVNRWIHVVFGFLGLAAFWVPILTRKGAKQHRRFGRVFRYSAMVVITAAGISITLHLLRLLLAGQSPAMNPVGWAILVFLGYLALVTGVMLSHGIAVLGAKRDLRKLNTIYHRLLAWLSISGSLIIIGWALYWQPPNAFLLYALSPLGIVIGVGMLKLCRMPADDPKTWLYEHLGAMLGTGIAFHTAFAVFGVNRLLHFELPGMLMVIPWLLPTALGIPASIMWKRHYRRKALLPARS
jgi:hypothetical protein